MLYLEMNNNFRHVKWDVRQRTCVIISQKNYCNIILFNVDIKKIIRLKSITKFVFAQGN